MDEKREICKVEKLVEKIHDPGTDLPVHALLYDIFPCGFCVIRDYRYLPLARAAAIGEY